MSNRYNPRSFVSVYRARRARPARAASILSRDRRPLARPAADEGALALLSDILVGDSAWTMAEVQRLISMRESAELGRWRAAWLDEEDASDR